MIQGKLRKVAKDTDFDFENYMTFTTSLLQFIANHCQDILTYGLGRTNFAPQ